MEVIAHREHPRKLKFSEVSLRAWSGRTTLAAATPGRNHANWADSTGRRNTGLVSRF